MSLFLDDAERLYSELENKLVSAIYDRKNCESCFTKEASESNIKWVESSRKKEAIMYAVVDELKKLVELAKLEDEMMNSIDD